MLAMGSRGIDVEELQKSLAAAGIAVGPADGIFGPQTRDAVERLQLAAGLPDHGVADDKTTAALRLMVPHQAEDKQLTEHFNELEFVCNDDSGLVAVNPKLLSMLEKLRAALGGFPVNILSGYRTPAHNDAIGGAPESLHLRGWAADIQIDNVEPEDVAAAAEPIFDGIGRYAEFTHVDVRGYRARW